MTTVFKAGLLLTVVLASVCAIAASAQALTITPTGTAVSAVAANPSFTYGGLPVTCDAGTALGTTRSPASNSMSLTVSFQGTCTMGGIWNATVSCSGNVTLVVSGAATSGTFNLDTGFTCTITFTGICTLDIEGPQITGNNGTLNEAATTLTATVTLTATRTGTQACGPSTGQASFSASYTVTPTTLSIT
jgi:hypothetical protein